MARRPLTPRPSLPGCASPPWACNAWDEAEEEGDAHALWAHYPAGCAERHVLRDAWVGNDAVLRGGPVEAELGGRHALCLDGATQYALLSRHVCDTPQLTVDLQFLWGGGAAGSPQTVLDLGGGGGEDSARAFLMQLRIVPADGGEAKLQARIIPGGVGHKLTCTVLHYDLVAGERRRGGLSSAVLREGDSVLLCFMLTGLWGGGLSSAVLRADWAVGVGLLQAGDSVLRAFMLTGLREGTGSAVLRADRAVGVGLLQAGTQFCCASADRAVGVGLLQGGGLSSAVLHADWAVGVGLLQARVTARGALVAETASWCVWNAETKLVAGTWLRARLEVHQPESRCEMYIDGQLTAAGIIAIPTTPPAAGGFEGGFLGRARMGGENFTGGIRDVRIYRAVFGGNFEKLPPPPPPQWEYVCPLTSRRPARDALFQERLAAGAEQCSPELASCAGGL
ncbi:hypothetical protein CYMTET_30748 [Cymbomonas tetramitiformis]|uniref:Uncharacterized protein n=1 Tax=Cymbomonas tetramitiformis TaxID=36881 RepID=A0AAE0FJQ2_9CHLO|nr:hypothetical protein CYMTET_30748 [Cymbomonas tetramitiformis]